MARLSGRVRVLSDKEMQLVHSAALDILAGVGLRVHHDRARRYLIEAGGSLCADSLTVKIPAAVVENAVAHLRRDFLSPARVGLKQAQRYSEFSYWRRDEELYHDFAVNAGGFCALLLDLDRHRRYATLTDVHDSFKLVNALDEITWSGLPVSDQQIPHELRCVTMAAELVKYTKKIGGIEAWSVADIRAIEEIAIVVRGSREALLREPVLVGYAETRTPLALDPNMAEIFIEYVRRGLPQSLDTMPAAGTTAPASGAATLALGLAETLAGLVLGWAVNPEAVLSLDFTGGYCDMGTLSFPYAGPDRATLLGARIQIFRELYGITAGVHGGKTNSCEPGFQAGMEKALSSLFPLLCGACGIGTVGQLEFGLTYSPVQLVLDCEVTAQVRRMLRGFEVNERTLALDLIRQVGPEGNFVTTDFTADNYRNEFWLGGLTECLAWDAWSAKTVRGMAARAEEKARQIMARPLEPVLSREQITEIDRIVASHARSVLQGKSETNK